MTSPPAEDTTPNGQFLVIHGVEAENLDMTTPTLKKERSTSDVILVPSHDLVFKANASSDDHDSSSSEDEISIHVEGPIEHDELDESLSSSAFTAVTQDTDATATDDPFAAPRRSRVRFRSRVRITSGLHHHRERDHQRRLSATSSLSSSPSSSISAPLRSPPTEDNCTPGWGTLGTRVGLFAISNRQAAAAAAQARNAKQRGRRRQGLDDLGHDEHSALLVDGAPPSYEGDQGDSAEYYSSDDEYSDEAVLSRQIDLVFGTWPGRLLNRQWWWWQLQPIVCCGCLDESDGED
ncbi:hypothetical protein C8R43DRAFT_1120131 [Mycena crocata]|nr:hypothetical protein C8R43DRAFT_1120131 [Mycena crocata]